MGEINLQVGKTYETRNGRCRVTITHESSGGLFSGTDQQGRVYPHSFFANGLYTGCGGGIDLVREVTP